MSGVGPDPRKTFNGQFDATSVTFTITQALALYNGIELILLIFTTFTKWRGLYFWSLTLATLGTIAYSFGLILEYFKVGSVKTSLPGILFDSFGWIFMVTGQSVVLYSRLGLILANRRILQAVKWMIIIDGTIFHVTANVLNFGGRWSNDVDFRHGYFYFEYIQMTGFCIQEFIISGLYLWKTTKLLKTLEKEHTKRVMYQLFAINIIIVVLDIALLVVEYKNWHIIEQCVKSLVYSVKLKLEFAILGKLVDIVKDSQRNMSGTLADLETFVDRKHPPSPNLERKWTPTAQWNAVNGSSDKGSINHVEFPGNGHVQTPGNGHVEEPGLSQHRMASIDTAASPSELESATRRRREGREGDEMYADVLRSISQT